MKAILPVMGAPTSNKLGSDLSISVPFSRMYNACSSVNLPSL